VLAQLVAGELDIDAAGINVVGTFLVANLRA
jgi:hypothetical protein